MSKDVYSVFSNVVQRAREGERILNFGDKVCFRQKWYVVRNSFRRRHLACELCAFSECLPDKNPCKCCIDYFLLPPFGYLEECEAPAK